MNIDEEIECSNASNERKYVYMMNTLSNINLLRRQKQLLDFLKSICLKNLVQYDTIITVPGCSSKTNKCTSNIYILH